jgi:formylglycine-generating enzyme required for sulfatase activity
MKSMQFSPVYRQAVILTLISAFFYPAPTLAQSPPVDPGTEFRDCDDCPRMIVVPAGKFLMGADGGEAARYEGPVHEVAIRKPFAVGVFELTNAEYAAFIAATDHQSGQNCRAWDGSNYSENPGRSWLDPGYGRAPRDDEPVACVNWNDARAYVEWLAQKTGLPYRLLSEAEWEYLARGNTPKGRFAWEGGEEAACRYANLFDTAGANGKVPRPYGPAPCNDGFAEVAPVGQLQANVFGVYDIIGNVWEWVEDCYVMTYFEWQNNEMPQVRHGCDRRGVRGGSWSTLVARQRPEFRGRDPAELTTHIFGFRIARDLPGDPAPAEAAAD